MVEKAVPLEIADPHAAIRYLGEMYSRSMDPIHEPIQNLLDENARRIDVELDVNKNQIRVRGDAEPITTEKEARRILTSICSSRKKGKLGEKGVGMLSFLTVGRTMTTTSQKGGRMVWFTLERDNLASGRVGSVSGRRLPYAGTEIRIKGVTRRNLKTRFNRDRVIRDIKRRWGEFLARGIEITVNGRSVVTFAPLQGEPFRRTLAVKELGEGARIEVSLMILKDPADEATVSVTHRGQANFLISNVPLFEGDNAFTQGMLHGTISGDVAPINASRTGFRETEAFDTWQNYVVELEAELGKIIEEQLRSSAAARNAAMLNDWMKHLKEIFRATELASTITSSGEGEEEGWREPGEKGGGVGGRGAAEKPGTPEGEKGDFGRMPTVPYAGFTKARPNIRVVREKKAFRINVNHPDFLLSTRHRGGTQKYIRELCMHEAFIYSLEGRHRDWYIERSDEFMGYWTRAFIGKDKHK